MCAAEPGRDDGDQRSHIGWNRLVALAEAQAASSNARARAATVGWRSFASA
jgi:hypothetical protein